MAKSSAEYFEVRWRIAGSDEAWGAPQRVEPHKEVVVEGLDRTKTYEFEARAVSACGAKSDWAPSTNHTVPGAPTGTLTLAALKAEADQAKTDAEAANAELADIASDNVLTPGEKPVVIRDYNVITTEQAGIDAQATAYAITTEKTAYDGKVTALTTYLGTLTSPTAWNDTSGSTTIVGATFRQKFADVYTSRQALLNAIYAAAKAKADAAQQTADEAHSLASQVAVLNPGFDAGDTGWTKEGGWTIESDGSFGVGQGYAKHVGSTTNQTKALRNNAICFVQPGKSYTVQALIKAVSANGQCFARISWRDISDTEIGTTVGNAITGTTVNGSYATGQAPNGAVYAHAEIATSAHTSGTYMVDNVVSTLQPATADEISESATKKWAGESGATVGAAWGSNVTNQPQATGANLVWHGDFTDNSLGGWATNDGGALQLNYPTGVTFGVGVQTKGRDAYETNNWIPVASGEVLFMRARLASGSVDLKLGMHFNDKDGNSQWVVAASRPAGNTWGMVQGTITVPSGYIKGRPWIGQNITAGSEASTGYFAQVDLQRTALMQSGSGAKLGGLRNQVMVGVGNFASAWSGGAITYSATSTSATITAGAANLIAGDDSIAYNQSSTTVSGSAGATTKFYLYYDDADYTGGSQTLHATTSVITSLNANGRLKVGEVTVTFPTSGTGTGGGSAPCPDENAWVLRADPNGIRPDWPVRAGTVRVGHFLRLTDGRTGCVTYSERKAADRVRVRSEHHRTLTCSTSAPLELAVAAGECVLAPDSKGELVRVRHLGVPASPIVAQVLGVEDAGPGYVQHITCQNACFWTGDDPDYLFGHHNMKPAN